MRDPRIAWQGDLSAFVLADIEGLFTDSRAVAIAFGRRHRTILLAIENLRRSGQAAIAEHARLNFRAGTFVDDQGRMRRMYFMTASGLSELASFRGDDARVVRIRFLRAFEEVAERLARAERAVAEQLEFQCRRRRTTSMAKPRLSS